MTIKTIALPWSYLWHSNGVKVHIRQVSSTVTRSASTFPIKNSHSLLSSPIHGLPVTTQIPIKWSIIGPPGVNFKGGNGISCMNVGDLGSTNSVHLLE